MTCHFSATNSSISSGQCIYPVVGQELSGIGILFSTNLQKGFHQEKERIKFFIVNSFIVTLHHKSNNI